MLAVVAAKVQLVADLGILKLFTLFPDLLLLHKANNIIALIVLLPVNKVKFLFPHL